MKNTTPRKSTNKPTFNNFKALVVLFIVLTAFEKNYQSQQYACHQITKEMVSRNVFAHYTGVMAGKKTWFMITKHHHINMLTEPETYRLATSQFSHAVNDMGLPSSKFYEGVYLQDIPGFKRIVMLHETGHVTILDWDGIINHAPKLVVSLSVSSHIVNTAGPNLNTHLRKHGASHATFKIDNELFKIDLSTPLPTMARIPTVLTADFYSSNQTDNFVYYFSVNHANALHYKFHNTVDNFNGGQTITPDDGTTSFTPDKVLAFEMSQDNIGCISAKSTIGFHYLVFVRMTPALKVTIKILTITSYAPSPHISSVTTTSFSMFFTTFVSKRNKQVYKINNASTSYVDNLPLPQSEPHRNGWFRVVPE